MNCKVLLSDNKRYALIEMLWVETDDGVEHYNIARACRIMPNGVVRWRNPVVIHDFVVTDESVEMPETKKRTSRRSEDGGSDEHSVSINGFWNY